MDICILGLLIIKSSTIYDLNQSFKNSLSLFYSASFGSLQVTLKKLLELGYVDFYETAVGKRRKKNFRITESGQAYFFGAMFGEVNIGKLETTVLTRVFFLGLLGNNEQKIRVLQILEAAILGSLEHLGETKKQLSMLSIPPDYQKIYTYQTATLEYGLMSTQLGLDWVRGLLSGIQKSL